MGQGVGSSGRGLEGHVQGVEFISTGNMELWEGLSRLEFPQGLSGCRVKNGLNGRSEFRGAEKQGEAVVDNQESKESGSHQGDGGEAGRRAQVGGT